MSGCRNGRHDGAHQFQRIDSAMNCSNCGAPIQLIESRRYFFCRHCGFFHFPEPPDAEGVRILGLTPDAPCCPVCTAPMAQAVLHDVHPVQFCAKCRGVLMPRRVFVTVVHVRRSWASNRPTAPQPLDRGALERGRSCPLCHRRMVTPPYYGPGNVVIDNCEACDVIWLDFGEMRQIVETPGNDRGRRDHMATDDDLTLASLVSGTGAIEAEDPLSFLFDLLS